MTSPPILYRPFAGKKPVSPYSGYNGQLLTSVYQPTEMALMHKGPVSVATTRGTAGARLSAAGCILPDGRAFNRSGRDGDQGVGGLPWPPHIPRVAVTLGTGESPLAFLPWDPMGLGLLPLPLHAPVFLPLRPKDPTT